MDRDHRVRRTLALAGMAGILLLGSGFGSSLPVESERILELGAERPSLCASSAAHGGVFTLVGPSGSCPDCMCGNPIFEDGFESGGTTAWSTTYP